MYKGIIIENSLTDKIKYSVKSTWAPAINYGKSIGIPEEQLNFPID